MAEVRRTFAPVVLLGLASAGLAAVAGNRDWAAVDEGPTLLTHTEAGGMPLAGALALVVLAAWGVVLVTRGAVRRLVTVVGLLAALGLLAVALMGFSRAPANLRQAVAQLAYDAVGVHRTGWYWASLVAAVACVATSAAAVRLAPDWPEMGARYDAPDGRVRPELAPDATGLDLWKAIDDGRDPTLHERQHPDP